MDSARTLLDTTSWNRNLHPLAQAVRSSSSNEQLALAPFILLFTPPHTAIVSFVKELGNDSFWPAWVIASMSAGWWLTLPLLIFGIVSSLSSKHHFWVIVAATFVAWYFIASYARGVSTIESVRTREEMLPLMLLLESKGTQWLLTLHNRFVFRRWLWLLIAYYLLLFVSAIFYSVGAEILSCCA